MDSNCIEIKIFKDVAFVKHPIKRFDDSGKPPDGFVSKTVKVSELVNAIKGADSDIESPILPSCCIKYKEKGNTTLVFLLHEETRFDANCSGQIYQNCIRPNILMVYSLIKDSNNEYSISGTQAYGVKDSVNIVSDKTILWGLPFPNIGTDGYVCWGSNSVAGKFKSLTSLKVYVERIFNSPFNNHLFYSSGLSPFGINSNHDLFKFLQDKPYFPYEILENLGSKKTIGSI